MPDAKREPPGPKTRYRVRNHWNLSVFIERGGNRSPATIVAELHELSAEGAKLSVAAPVEDQEPITLILNNDESALKLPAEAEVRWVRPTGKGTWLVGCAFVSRLPEEAIESLTTQGCLDGNEFARRSVGAEATAWLESDPTPISVRLVDLSDDGFGLVSSKPGKIGQRMRVVLKEPNGKDIELLAQIRWCAQNGEGYCLGCECTSDEFSALLRDAMPLPEALCPTAGPPSRRSSGRSHWLRRLWKRPVQGGTPGMLTASAKDSPEDTEKRELGLLLREGDSRMRQQKETVEEFRSGFAQWRDHLHQLSSQLDERLAQFESLFREQQEEEHRQREALETFHSQMTRLRDERDRFASDLQERQAQADSLRREKEEQEHRQRRVVEELHAQVAQLRGTVAHLEGCQQELTGLLQTREETEKTARLELQAVQEKLQSAIQHLQRDPKQRCSSNSSLPASEISV